MITRRALVVQAGGAFAWVLTGACSPPKTRAGVLEAIVGEVVVPDLRALGASSLALEQALSALDTAADSERAAALARARAAFKRSLLDWQRAYAFRAGPAVDSNAFLRSIFWPARPAALARLLERPAGADAALVEAAGVDAKGLFALEQLLFDAQQDLLTGPLAARRRSLARVLAHDVVQRARGVSERLGDGRAFAREFAAGGHEALSRLVNQMVETIETIAVDRLARVLGLFDSRRLRASELPGGPSGLSWQIPLAQLEATHAFYAGARGGGLRALLELANPAVEERVSQAFAAAVTALRGLGAPLEQAVVRDRTRVQAAADGLRALELALKTELSAALSVTLSIASGDGD